MTSQVVVVTGGTAGLGRSIANEFAGAGYRVAVIGREQSSLEDTASELRSKGGSAAGVEADVADWRQVDDAASEIERTLGPIDIWVNNAMASVFAPFKDMSVEDFHRATEVTYFGFVHGTKAALNRMLPRDKGVIVQVGSALALRSIPLQSAYCGAKHAMLGFTESLRTELLHDGTGVKVTMVHMPAMNTAQFEWVRTSLPGRPRPVAPIYQPEVGASAVRHAAENPGRRAYYVGGSTVLTVWGNKFAAGLLDHYLARTGYDAQLEKSEEPPTDDNLYKPVSAFHRAHGRFDSKSHPHSGQLAISLHRRLAGGVVGALAGASGAATLKRSRKGR